MIYCIGDSHINIFSGSDIMANQFSMTGSLPYFRSCWISAVLAYNLIDNSNFFTIIESLPESSKVLLNLGEIDCRMQILKQSEKILTVLKSHPKYKKQALDYVISNTVKRYFEAINKIEAMGHTVYVFGPSVIAIDEKYKKELDIPSYGSSYQINRNILQFNDQLKKQCIINNNYYFNINKYLISSGEILSKYYRDKIHLLVSVVPFIINELKKDKII